MQFNLDHDWNLSAKDAIALQRKLSNKVSLHDYPLKIRYVAGVDVAFPNNGRTTQAAVCVFSAETNELVEQKIALRVTHYPYIPGLLSFREIPAILDALEKLNTQPDLYLCDGQGIAHPRYCGIACHIGLLTNTPSIGVGKSCLVGEHLPVPNKKGSRQRLIYKNRYIGAALRTRVNVKPVYVSPGHLLSIDSSINWVMTLLTRYKLPEPIRAADKLASNRTNCYTPACL